MLGETSGFANKSLTMSIFPLWIAKNKTVL